MDSLLPLPASSFTSRVHCRANYVAERVLAQDRVSRLHSARAKRHSPTMSSIIVSISVDVSGDADAEKLEEKGVKGRYTSVERVQELDNGKVEWRMATSSTPGGSIPQFIAESSMASTISRVSYTI